MKNKLLTMIFILMFFINVKALGETTIKNVKLNNQNMECVENICSGNVSKDTFQITFELTDPLAKVEGFASGEEHTLTGDKMNLSLKITNGDNSYTYNFLVTKYVKNNDVSLLKLMVNEEDVKLTKEVYVYNITSKYSDEEVKIEATVKDPKAKIKYPTDLTFPLDRSSKSFDFTVTAEDGTEQTYRIVMQRGKKPNVALSQIKLSSGSIELKDDVYEYEVNVPYEVNELFVEAYPVDDKAKVSIKKEDYLTVGLNKIEITVSINEIEQKYLINVKRLENIDDNAINIANVNIKNYKNLNFVSSNTKYDLYFKEIPSSLDIDVELVSNHATVDILNNENLEDGSKIILKTSIKDLNLSKEYELNIHLQKEKEINKTVLLVLIIILLIIILVLGIFEIRNYRINKKKKVSKKVKKEEEIIEEI